jgi:hypothetical protein
LLHLNWYNSHNFLFSAAEFPILSAIYRIPKSVLHAYITGYCSFNNCTSLIGAINAHSNLPKEKLMSGINNTYFQAGDGNSESDGLKSLPYFFQAGKPWTAYSVFACDNSSAAAAAAAIINRYGQLSRA